MRRVLLGLALAWCAVDYGGRVYACFGFDFTACQRFVAEYRGENQQRLQCRVV